MFKRMKKSQNPIQKKTIQIDPSESLGFPKGLHQNLFFNMKASLFLYTFDTKFLEQNIKILEGILSIFKKKNLLDYKQIGQPTRKKHSTLLRSPHIDKKSREQYIRMYQKVLFELDFYNTKTMEIFYSHIQKRILQGASLFFEWNTHDYLFPSSRKKD